LEFVGLRSQDFTITKPIQQIENMTRPLVRSFILLILTVTAVYFTSLAHAEMLTFSFSGTLTEVVGDYGATDGWGSVGDPFWGTLSFDPTWQNLNNQHLISTGDYGFYDYLLYRDPPEQAITFSLSTPSVTRQVPNGALNVTTLTAGFYQGNHFFSCDGEYAHGASIWFNLADATGAGISGANIPSNLDLSNWAIHYVDIHGLTQGAKVRGEITSLQLVPEPRTELVVGLGFIAWGLAQRALRGRRKVHATAILVPRLPRHPAVC
jgi:hypothetical protein